MEGIRKGWLFCQKCRLRGVLFFSSELVGEYTRARNEGVTICVSRAFCSRDQEKRETARSLSKMVYKRKGVGPRGGASSYETLLSIPLPRAVIKQPIKSVEVFGCPEGLSWHWSPADLKARELQEQDCWIIFDNHFWLMNSRRPLRVNTDYYTHLKQCKRQEITGFLYSRKLAKIRAVKCCK